MCSSVAASTVLCSLSLRVDSRGLLTCTSQRRARGGLRGMFVDGLGLTSYNSVEVSAGVKIKVMLTIVYTDS